MPNKLPNPYEEEIDEPTIRVSPTVCWFVAGIFLGLLSLPPLMRNLTAFLDPAGWVPVVEFFVRPTDEALNLLADKKRSDPRITRKSPNFIDHRESWEAKLEDAEFSEAPRRQLQAALTTILQEGNRKTVIGEDGWLFFRPAIDALSGYGPLKGEPDSVAKDPTRPPWQGPKAAILEFAEQLQAKNVELMLVPIPVKPMIYGLNGEPYAEPLLHRDAFKFYTELEQAGVAVLDLAPAMVAWARDTEVFLKQDTHWNPRTMERGARAISDVIRSREWFAEVDSLPSRFSYEPGKAAYVGDLVEKLDFPEDRNPFVEERVSLTHVISTENREPIDIYDRESPIVLLGDSFTNIFSAESMQWGTNAGFAQHLSRHLGLSLDTIAQNGQASTGVRQTLASRPEALEGKKLVVWAIAARDLFLSETVARETNVEWLPVTFNDAPKPKPYSEGALVLKGEVIARAVVQDPKTVSYPDSLYEVKYRVVEVVQGEFVESEVLVVHWGFQNRELLPSSKYQIGEVRELVLVPFDEKPDLQSINRSGLDDFLLIPYWAEEE
ncbi:MAG: hypothetical protein AAGH89_04890 [Verrucomicrobiota bacterium]